MFYLDGSHCGTEVGQVVEEDAGRGRRQRAGSATATGNAASLGRDCSCHLRTENMQVTLPFSTSNLAKELFKFFLWEAVPMFNMNV